MTEPEHPDAQPSHAEHPHAQHLRPIDHDTPAAPTDDEHPSKHHGDPLLAASKGATEGTEGSRHGHHEREGD